MINKFYHDNSYQRFDNNLAIFIRGIPKNVAHSKLLTILRERLFEEYESSVTDENSQICIDYIDVNYNKQFAFVYCGNAETLQIALKMKYIEIDGYFCQIERKKSHNGPRKFTSLKKSNSTKLRFGYQ